MVDRAASTIKQSSQLLARQATSKEATEATEATDAIEDSDQDSITSDMMVQLALSEDP